MYKGCKCLFYEYRWLISNIIVWSVGLDYIRVQIFKTDETEITTKDNRSDIWIHFHLETS